MDSMDNVRERFEVLEQRTEHLQLHTQALEAQTRTVGRRLRRWRLPWTVAAVATLGLALALPLAIQAKTFHCGADDVQCLIDAINAANANGKKNTIRLAAGTYTLPGVDNEDLTTGATGLPVVTSPLTITGAGAESTIIERALGFTLPFFHLMHVATAGSLTLKELTLRGGIGGRPRGGGAIVNDSTLTILHCTLTGNFAGPDSPGGAISTSGPVTIIGSTLTDNFGDVAGGIALGCFENPSCTLTIRNSTLARNRAPFGGGGAIRAGGTVTITNSTLTDNSAGIGGAIATGGTVTITNSTLADNHAASFALGDRGIGGGIIAAEGATVKLLNTILARNTVGSGGVGPDCDGPVTSLGNNIVGDASGCTITLQPSDLTGDPGLDAFTDNGKPGNGHVPLLPTSQAIDAGNDAVCPRRDQLGQRRINIRRVGTSICDIGAIEFHPHDEAPVEESE